MEELFSPVKIHNSRKRKKILPSSSNCSHLIGRLTRSKSRLYTHQNRSGISRPDRIPSKPKFVLPKIEPVESLSDVNCDNPSRISSIIDLRMRRVFTRDVNSVLQEEEEEEAEDETADMKRLLKCSESSPVSNLNVVGGELEKSEVIVSNTEVPARNDLENGLNMKVDELEKSEVLISNTDGPARNDSENGLNLKDDELEKSEILISKSEGPARNDFENGLNSKDHEISGDGYNSKNKMALNRCRRRKIFRASSSFSYKRLLPYLMDIANDDSSLTKIEIVDSVKSEMMSFAKCVRPRFDDLKMPFDQDSVQMTPPDHAILTDTEIAHVGEPIEAENVLGEKQTFKSSEKSKGDVSTQSINRKHDTNSVNSLILNPGSRVFSNPRSLSYRRLLPFLIDISQNNSSDSRISRHPTPRMGKEKDTAEKTENSYEKQDHLPPSNGPSTETNNNDLVYLNGEPKSVTSEMPIDLRTEKKSEPDSDHRKLESCSDTKQNCIESPSSVTINNDICKNQSTPIESGRVNCTDMGLELLSKNLDPIDRFDMNRNSLTSEAMVYPANDSFRGILKRNRKGCRGLCNCLNCASFRLHADRAFEFSRNQMHDAEEVASDLMKELANLRFLMEKSIVSDDDLPAIQPNTLLIKEVCNKALEAENLAKVRLGQLNYDLNVHCRIPMLLEPKVTFANYIQENAVTLSDSLASRRKNG